MCWKRVQIGSKIGLVLDICEPFKRQSEAYSEPCWASDMEFFVIIINIWKPLTIFTKCSILDVWQGSEKFLSITFMGDCRYILNLGRCCPKLPYLCFGTMTIWRWILRRSREGSSRWYIRQWENSILSWVMVVLSRTFFEGSSLKKYCFFFLLSGVWISFPVEKSKVIYAILTKFFWYYNIRVKLWKFEILN